MFADGLGYASSAVRYWPVDGLFLFSPCALLDKTAHKSVPRSSRERGGFVFSLACFLEKGPALSNTRQGRECLSISRRSATVRLCRRKIALPRYQFGLNLSAFHPDIYIASGCLGHRSPVHSQKNTASAGRSGSFVKHGLFRWRDALIPKRHRLWHVQQASYVEVYQLKVTFRRNAKPARKHFRYICFYAGSGITDSDPA